MWGHGTPPKILRGDDDIHPLVGGSLAAIGLIVLAIAAVRFGKPLVSAGGPAFMQLAAARQRRFHFLRLVWASANPIAQILTVPGDNAPRGISLSKISFNKKIIFLLHCPSAFCFSLLPSFPHPTFNTPAY
jgi:hypothetical protein